MKIILNSSQTFDEQWSGASFVVTLVSCNREVRVEQIATHAILSLDENQVQMLFKDCARSAIFLFASPVHDRMTVALALFSYYVALPGVRPTTSCYEFADPAALFLII